MPLGKEADLCVQDCMCTGGRTEQGRTCGQREPDHYLVRILQDSKAALLIFITFHFPLMSSGALSNFIRSFSSWISSFLKGCPGHKNIRLCETLANPSQSYLTLSSKEINFTLHEGPTVYTPDKILTSQSFQRKSIFHNVRKRAIRTWVIQI